MGKKKTKMEGIAIIPSERIVSKIFVIRRTKVMLDRDLAELYGVETRELNQAVRRNIKRFPEDFMFQLTKEEMENWKSQIVISNRERMGLWKPPLAFTEQGVAMLSSVLKSERAIEVNVLIIRTFTKLREMLASHIELQRKIEDMERRYGNQFKEHGQQIKAIFEAIRQLLMPPEEPKRRIGFGVKYSV
jgi:ORF6N domain